MRTAHVKTSLGAGGCPPYQPGNASGSSQTEVGESSGSRQNKTRARVVDFDSPSRLPHKTSQSSRLNSLNTTIDRYRLNLTSTEHAAATATLSRASSYSKSTLSNTISMRTNLWDQVQSLIDHQLDGIIFEDQDTMTDLPHQQGHTSSRNFRAIKTLQRLGSPPRFEQAVVERVRSQTAAFKPVGEAPEALSCSSSSSELLDTM